MSKVLHPQTDYALDLLVAAGHITREKAFQTRDIVLEFGPGGPSADLREGAGQSGTIRVDDAAGVCPQYIHWGGTSGLTFHEAVDKARHPGPLCGTAAECVQASCGQG